MFDSTRDFSVRFPEGFVWGAATSAHQVEGRTRSNQWADFEKREGFIERGESAVRACNQYELYEQDFKLAASLGHNAHRLSIEWSRICPERGIYDKKEIEHYRKVFQAIKDNGMKIMLTLHHFTEPSWFFDEGSFTREGSWDDFADFVARAAKEYGEMIDYWATFNEPQIGLLGWYWGEFPPMEKDSYLTCKLTAGILKAHAAARNAIRAEIAGAKVGIVMATGEFRPLRDRDLLDSNLAELLDYLWMESYIQGIRTGKVVLPEIGEDEFVAGLKDSCDFWGVNYYTECTVDSRSPRGVAGALPGERVTGMGWRWAPDGLYRQLERFGRDGVKLFVTENGIATDDDNERVRFISEHLRALHAAIEKGIDIGGYFHWSLLDNFEWRCGYRPRFGLVHVDFETMQRTPKPSAEFYHRIIRGGVLDKKLLDEFLPDAYRF